MRTTAVVHETVVDSEPKVADIIRQLVLRLERRAGHKIGWLQFGPVPIRDTWRRVGDGQMFILYVVEAQ